jgi:hypothetical protein
MPLVGEVGLAYIKRLKARKVLTGDERVAERVVCSIFVDTIASEPGSNIVHGLLTVPEDN